MPPPGPDGPFSIADGKLTIAGRKDANGEWASGTMQTVDGKGRGFAQQYGYFEMCAEFPPGPGAWPAFWLKAQKGDTDLTITRSEIDVIEWYGSDPKHVHNGIHLWPGRPPKPGALTKPIWKSKITAVPLQDGKLSGYHTYGVLITPDWIVMYYDRKELTRFPTLPEHRTPHYMLVSLAIEPDQPTATSPKVMKVDYVRAYATKGARWDGH
jgi:beta-glucanase (GH16 family)